MTGSGQPQQVQGSDPELAVKILSEDEFSSCDESWNHLLNKSVSESFFLKWEWVYTFWKTIDRQDAAPLVCFVYDGAEIVGIAPLYSYSCKLMYFPVRKIAFLGDRVASDYLDIFTLPDYEDRCCRAVVRQFQSESIEKFTLLEFDGVCTDSNIYRYMVSADAGADDALVLPRFDCPRTVLPTNFDTYVKSLGASARYYLGRKQRKLEKTFANMEVRHVDLHESPDLLDVLFDLHDRRWRTLAGRSSTFYSDFRKRFNSELLKRLENGDGFFSCVLVDSQPVSIMYTFLYKKNAYFYQNGWDPEYAPYSIGIYNIQEAMRFAIGRGCKTFDFLRGPERYKYTFCNDVRQAYVIFLFSHQLTGRCLKGLVQLKQGLKKILDR